MKYNLINKTISFKDFTEDNDSSLMQTLENDGYRILHSGKADIVHFNIDIDHDDPGEMLANLKSAWKDTKTLLAVSSLGIKQREIHQFLENLLSCQVTPVCPGMFFVFKDDTSRENYIYNTIRRLPEDDLTWEENKLRRKNDILVYLALARFRNENVISNLSDRLQEEIKLYIGNFLKAVSLSKKYLFAAGDKEQLTEICEGAPAGINDSKALLIHSSAVPDLDPKLRVFIGMAGIFYGDIANSDIIKIHKKSAKISFYNYDDFNNKALPELHTRIKVDLARQKMNFYNHKSQKEQQLLYFKERYVLESHPAFQKWATFSETLRGYGVEEIKGYGPSLQALSGIIGKEELKKII